MHHTFAPFRRSGRYRALVVTGLVVALAACDNTEALAPEALAPEIEVLAPEAEPVDAPEMAVSQIGGIPFGMAAQPVSEFGDTYSGAKMTIGPSEISSRLSAVRSRGGRVIVMLAGNPRHYTDASGRFSLSKWKARVDRFKKINLDTYINDGTLAGHYMIDEPNDPANWNGATVSPATLDEMGRYSKQLWPKMPTIVRTHPNWFKSAPKYVDAAWAQYLSRRGPVKDYIRKQVADAQQRKMALVVGMNVLRGGTPNGTKMTATQVKSWGSELLSSSYPCAFVSWQYNSTYLNNSGIRSAMKELRKKAQNRTKKTCRF